MILICNIAHCSAKKYLGVMFHNDLNSANSKHRHIRPMGCYNWSQVYGLQVSCVSIFRVHLHMKGNLTLLQTSRATLDSIQWQAAWCMGSWYPLSKGWVSLKELHWLHHAEVYQCSMMSLYLCSFQISSPTVNSTLIWLLFWSSVLQNFVLSCMFCFVMVNFSS